AGVQGSRESGPGTGDAEGGARRLGGGRGFHERGLARRDFDIFTESVLQVARGVSGGAGGRDEGRVRGDPSGRPDPAGRLSGSRDGPSYPVSRRLAGGVSAEYRAARRGVET